MPNVLAAIAAVALPVTGIAAGYLARRTQLRRRGEFASVTEFAGRLDALGRR